MVSERPEVEAALRRILHSLDYKVRHKPSEHAGGKWLSSFRSALGGHANLEVDLNFMARQPLFGAARMQSVEFSGISATDILVLDLHEIVAGKLVALFDRCTGRDLFDLSRILLIDVLDWRKIKAAVLAFGACAHRDWRKVTVNTIKKSIQATGLRSRAEEIRQAIEYYLEEFDDLSVIIERLSIPSDPVLDWGRSV